MCGSTRPALATFLAALTVAGTAELCGAEEQAREPATVRARVLADRLNVRCRPSRTAEVVTQLRQGELVNVRGDAIPGEDPVGDGATWTRIILPHDRSVWVFVDYVDRTTGRVTANELRVRSGPGTEHAILGSVGRGDVLEVRRVAGDWVEVAPPQGTFAFVATAFLAIDAVRETPLATLETPSVTPPSPTTHAAETGPETPSMEPPSAPSDPPERTEEAVHDGIEEAAAVPANAASAPPELAPSAPLDETVIIPTESSSPNLDSEPANADAASAELPEPDRASDLEANLDPSPEPREGTTGDTEEPAVQPLTDRAPMAGASEMRASPGLSTVTPELTRAAATDEASTPAAELAVESVDALPPIVAEPAPARAGEPTLSISGPAPPTEPEASTTTVTTPDSPKASPERPPRIVAREGLVRRTLSIQAPGAFELRSPNTGERIVYLHPRDPELDIGQFRGRRARATGEEFMDPRWPNCPVLFVDRITLAP